ncbi:related to Serine protease [Ustilago trichophora]|uniref:Related to Serine protease n=1 Tax=Ustilago trichophora TaxID=86804 RepID=A0A5C3DTF8_9BASI|nr:related to Serine protease [Ustilago trichophora]
MSRTEPRTLTYVSGSSDPEQKLDLYLPSTTASSLIIFIHGGAWRTGSRNDHADLANYLCGKGKAVAVLDYRLSVKDKNTGLPKVIHPVHAEDVNAALLFLHGRIDVPKKDWVVVGHSIGAWLTLAAIIDGIPREGNSQYPAPMPLPNSAARDCIKTCVLVDGIFSVSKMLKEYPDYEGFVAQAFLPQPGPSSYDVVSCETWPLALEGKNLHVWHSRDDELLSFKQSIDVILYLDEQIDGSTVLGAALVEIPQDGVASTTNVDGEKKSIASVYGQVKIRNAARLHADLTTLKGAHDELLHTETFWDLILKL